LAGREGKTGRKSRDQTEEGGRGEKLSVNLIQAPKNAGLMTKQKGGGTVKEEINGDGGLSKAGLSSNGQYRNNDVPVRK